MCALVSATTNVCTLRAVQRDTWMCMGCARAVAGPAFCGWCGTRLKRRSDALDAGPRNRVVTYEQRWARLREQYSTDTTSRHRAVATELLAFMSALGVDQPVLYDVTPRDVVYYLMSKDVTGQTVVHARSCEDWGQRTALRNKRCGCPVRAAAGTVDTVRGTVSALFRDIGLTAAWDAGACTGNPARSALVDNSYYLDLVEREQSTAGVRVRQAPLIGVCVFDALMSALLSALEAALSAKNWFESLQLARDGLMFSVLWHSGLRADDAMKMCTKQLFEGSSLKAGWQLRVHVTKTSWDVADVRLVRFDDENKRTGVPAMWRLWSNLLGDAMRAGVVDGMPEPLFPAMEAKKGRVLWLRSEMQWRHVDERLRLALKRAQLSNTIKPHSFRASLARMQRDSGMHADVICKRVGWTLQYFHHYTDPRDEEDVLDLARARSLYAAEVVARPQSRKVQVPVQHPAAPEVNSAVGGFDNSDGEEEE